MRKLASIAGAAFLALTALATPASAQTPSAGGSCGAYYGQYGMTNVNSSMVNQSTQAVPVMFFEVNYSGVPAPTTVGVIVRYNDELETQFTVVNLGTAQNSGGSFRRQIFPGGQGISLIAAEGGAPGEASGFRGPDPEAVGTANSIDNSFRGRSDNGPVTFSGNESGNKVYAGYLRGGTGNSGTNGGLNPGEYVFYIYTGSLGDVWNIKDGTVSRGAFIADEKGYLGKFSCGVSTNQGSGPG